MLKNIATVGSRFEGYCSACDEHVQGSMVEGEFVTVEGKNVCVVGSRGVGDCGHTTYAHTGSSVAKINGSPIARVGDEVKGTIDGNIITGEFVKLD